MRQTRRPGRPRSDSTCHWKVSRVSPADDKPINVALLGLGLIGSEVYSHFSQDPAVHVSRVLVRDKAKQRSVQLSPGVLTEDFAEILGDPSVPIVVELTGDGEAHRDYVLPALRGGKHVVTANKKILANNWAEIVSATESGSMLRIDAAVGGGLPVVLPTQHLSKGGRIDRVAAVLNGTTNYILWRMRQIEGELGQERATIEQLIEEAGEQGLCEPDPAEDLDGTDTISKLVILANLAFDGAFNPADAQVRQGIRQQAFEIRAADFYYVAQRFPTRHQTPFDIKLLGVADRDEQGQVTLRVQLFLLKVDHPLSLVTTGALNSVLVKGADLGSQYFFGTGAGPKPTTVAIAAGVRQIVSQLGKPVSWMGYPAPRTVPLKPIQHEVTQGLVRSYAPDLPGVFKKKLEVFERLGVNIQNAENVGSAGRPYEGKFIETDGSMPDYISVGPTTEGLVQEALEGLRSLDGVSQVCYFPIYDDGGDESAG